MSSLVLSQFAYSTKSCVKLTLTWDNCLVNCKCSSKSTPRYLTDWVGKSCFSCSFLNLERSS